MKLDFVFLAKRVVNFDGHLKYGRRFELGEAGDSRRPIENLRFYCYFFNDFHHRTQLATVVTNIDQQHNFLA